MTRPSFLNVKSRENNKRSEHVYSFLVKTATKRLSPSFQRKNLPYAVCILMSLHSLQRPVISLLFVFSAVHGSCTPKSRLLSLWRKTSFIVFARSLKLLSPRSPESIYRFLRVLELAGRSKPRHDSLVNQEEEFCPSFWQEANLVKSACIKQLDIQ